MGGRGMSDLRVLRDVLRNGDIRRVQGGWLLAWTAEWVYVINLLVLAYLVGGIVAVGLVSMLRMLPAAMVAPMLAMATDRTPRHRVLLGVNLVRATMVALAAVTLPLIAIISVRAVRWAEARAVMDR
jgi:hypothetical protein